METRVTDTELAKSLSDILNRVRYLRERFLIESDSNGNLIAALIPAPQAPGSGITMEQLAALLTRLVLPGEGFAEDLEAIQSAQPQIRAPSWPN